jgi:integrase
LDVPLKRRGRPRRFAEYEDLLAGLPPKMSKRPKYVNGIGLFRGERDTTAWIKFTLPKGGVFKGRAYEAGESAEIKVGKLSSWTWEQLEAERNNLIGRAERGEALEDAPVIRFGNYAMEWLECRRRNVKSWAIERGHVKNSLMPYFADSDINVITSQDVNRWQAKQLETLAPATVQRQLNTLKTILNDARRAGKLVRNPCGDAKKLKGIEPRQRYLDMPEASQLITSAAEIAEWMPDFLAWLLHSGMRRGEALALTWADIRTVGDLTAVSIRNTKSGKPRFISCSSGMVDILERRKAAQPDQEKVFPIPLITLKRKMKLLRDKTGIHDIRLHDLRRTNATHLARAGVDLRTLSGRIGHHDLTMLHNVYSVFDKDDEAADAAQRVFGSLTTNPEDRSNQKKATV